MVKDIDLLRGHTILITGATGLIGKNIIKLFEQVNDTPGRPIKVLALVRNVEIARQIFG